MSKVKSDVEELSAEDIFGVEDLTVVPFTVPEWPKAGKPGLIYFRVMSAEAVIKFQDLLKSEEQKKKSWVRMFAECACDRNGNLLFTKDQMDRLLTKSSAVYLRMQKFLLQLNGMIVADKSWEALAVILVDAGVTSEQVAAIKAKWETPESVAKND